MIARQAKNRNGSFPVYDLVTAKEQPAPGRQADVLLKTERKIKEKGRIA